ncbi:MAG: ABC transporter substrate-binding protein [Sulfobacillus thermotolerans]|nr:ABC transporter substrate-binding protein [Sulfobacillus thermotolerans]
MEKKKTLKPFLAGLMVLPLMTIVAGCGTSGAASEPTVTIGYENAPDPESVAIEQNFFQKTMHAHVVLKYFSSGPDALTSLASGSLDFMTTLGNPPTAAAIARGVPLKVVWAMERYTTAEGLVVKNGSHIHSLQNLEGKTVALVSGSTSPFELDTALAMHHLPVSSVQINNMSPPDMVAAWKTGRIDAAYVWAPFLNEMQQDDGHILIYDQDQVDKAPIFNLAVVNAHFAAKNPQLVDEFVKAEEDGVKFFYQHPTKSFEDIAKLNGISPAEARSQAAGLSFTTLAQELTPRRLGTASTVKDSLVTRSLTSAAQWLKQTGQISSVPPNLSQYVDPSYCETVYHQEHQG